MIRICYNPRINLFCIGDLETKIAGCCWRRLYTDAIKEYYDYAMYAPHHTVFTDYKSYIYADVDESIDLYDIPKIFPELFL